VRKSGQVVEKLITSHSKPSNLKLFAFWPPQCFRRTPFNTDDSANKTSGALGSEDNNFSESLAMNQFELKIN